MEVNNWTEFIGNPNHANSTCANCGAQCPHYESEDSNHCYDWDSTYWANRGGFTKIVDKDFAADNMGEGGAWHRFNYTCDVCV